MSRGLGLLTGHSGIKYVGRTVLCTGNFAAAELGLPVPRVAAAVVDVDDVADLGGVQIDRLA